MCRTRILGKLLVLLMLSSVFGSAPGIRAAQTQSLVEGNTAFALNLYGQLKHTPGNLFFSPYSISTALAMTYAGARGGTEKQMGKVLSLRQGPGTGPFILRRAPTPTQPGRETEGNRTECRQRV